VGARVLIIEDNPDNLELMTYLLSAFGHTVLCAENGREGLETARREHADLIICDVQLPEMDGYEVVRHLKSDARLRSIPLVAVTALAMVGDRDRMLAAGFDGYVAKPINPETFVRQMEGYLRPAQHSAPLPPAGVAAPAPPRPETHYTILVVDNLPVNLDLARSLLQPCGYKVVTAGGMAEGLAAARRVPCDLIISDVCMSEGDGYEFIQAVRADPQLSAVPFIFITSTMLDEKDRDRGLALGAARFLRRPIEPDVFLAEVRACLREHGKG
jgi:two-component system cell cycle response regulator